jgi:cold-shock-like DNA binding protein
MRPASVSEATMIGKITRVAAERGFGFITSEDGQDYFFHRSAFDRDLDPLVQGLQPAARGAVRLDNNSSDCRGTHHRCCVPSDD